MEITNYKPGRGVLQGTFTLKLPKIRMEFRECTWFEKDGRRWFNFPSKAYEKDGQKKYFSLVNFETPDIKISFEKMFFEVLEKFLKENPQHTEAVQEEIPF